MQTQPQLLAQLTNPVTGDFGSDTTGAQEGTLFTNYFVMIWNTIITVGALLVLAYFLWGAVEWITSAGDSGKLQSARNRMFHAFIGLLLLVSAYTLIGFISYLFFGDEFNILQPVLRTVD
ncbi:MAG: hypothetical protein WDZ94_05235 [Patescibacteria group bacterium]